jgi:predicted aspartyl protease
MDAASLYACGIRIVICLIVSLVVPDGCIGSYARVSEGEQVVEVPFDFYQNEIVVSVRVNGAGPFDMMVDTGTDPSAVDLATAKALGLKLDPTGQPGSGGGTGVNLAYETKLPAVRVGGLVARNVPAVALDLSRMSQRLGRRLHGVLGHSLLNGRIVQIDYPGRVLRFYPASPFPKGEKRPNTHDRTVLRFRYDDNVLIDDVTVNGKKLTGEVDTGSDGTFKLTPAAVSYLGLEEQYDKAPVQSSVGFNGQSENRESQLENVTIGGISVDAPAAIFFGRGTGRDKKPWGINIGNAFLKDYVVTIDYRSKLITLERAR